MFVDAIHSSSLFDLRMYRITHFYEGGSQFRGSHCSIQNLIYNILLLQAIMNILHPFHVKQHYIRKADQVEDEGFSFRRQTTNSSSWNVCYNTSYFQKQNKSRIRYSKKHALVWPSSSKHKVKNNRGT